ncbi:MAG: hypothetical protein HFJ25_01345 [Clostridia bacterium]|nr:hypothetical protein [Clostridia bacterium]
MNEWSKLIEFIRKYKLKMIVLAILLVIIFLLLSNLLLGKPEKVLKSFVEDINSANVYELYEQVDWVGMYILYAINQEELGENFEGFWNKYEEVENSNQYREFKKKLDVKFENANNEIEDYFQKNKIKLEIKKVNKLEKINKNIYVGDVRIQATVNGKKDTYNDEIIIIKKGLKYYLISGEIVESALTDYLF